MSPTHMTSEREQATDARPADLEQGRGQASAAFGDPGNGGYGHRDEHGDGPVGNGLAVSLNDIRFSYDHGETWVLEGIDLDIREGERICLVGPNGSGKSTLARLIAGLTAPDGGSVTLLGEPVFEDGTPHSDRFRRARKGIGAVFQNPTDQIITTVVGDDVAFGPENLALTPDRITRRVDASLNAVDMGGYLEADPSRMSGGQQQRIAIAGILAMSPRMIVLDEPTAMLDTQSQRHVLSVLDALQRQGVTIVHVTHRPEELTRADRILSVEGGRLVELSATQAALRLAVTNANDTGTLRPDGVIINAGNGDTAPSASSPSLSRKPSERPDDDPAVLFDHVSFRYPKADADTLHDFSMRIERGEVVAIMGRNGTGKSTLTRLMTALSKPGAGRLEVAGIDLGGGKKHAKQRKKALRSAVGLVMQQPERQLFAETVRQDVAYGPSNQGLTQQQVDERVERALELMGIADLADRSPFSLSGGQQRLAAIAGTIACDPSILILDEPTAGLDAAASERIYALVRTLNAQGVTIVMVTHSLRQARQLADRVITLDGDAAAAHGHGDASPQPATAIPSSSPSSPHGGKRTKCKDAEERQARPSGPGAKTSHHRQPLVQRLDPRVKLVVFLVLMFTSFMVGSVPQLLLTLAMVVAMAAAARLSPRNLWHSLRGFVALLLVMGVVNMLFVRSGRPLLTIAGLPVTTDGVMAAILYTGRFGLVIVLGIILLQTTTPTALTDGFGSLLSPLRRLGLHTQELALVMSLALRFLPTLAGEARDVVDAQSARGGSIETGTPARRIHALAAIVVPIFAGALRHSDNLSLALDARCYEEGIHRTHWHAMHVARRDLVFIALCAIYLAVLLTMKAIPALPRL
ncbi:energy-coupling factor transporter ATPase [Bifidobacterium sp. ESL0763]|uniref:energy-coupling factor transporter ATPase n=1 Tax=Bifidobacterium sp. ESL0763 TaxID=2983227 RepID=UPI0023FA4771|nr:energy-coupling factor transporter ATPase [Bifidobacterium sp. ESL0763]MDF7663696.1 energy-coupling factor transporter ATPase [Bifidobacterium sp. ESL0763]